MDCTKLVEFAHSVTTHDRTIIIICTNALKNKVVSALKSKDKEGGWVLLLNCAPPWFLVHRTRDYIHERERERLYNLNWKRG